MYTVKDLDETTALIYPNGVDPSSGYKIFKKSGHPLDGKILDAFSDGKISVDKLLDNVDLKLDWYLPSDVAIEFMIFIRLVLGENPENSNPLPHYFFIDCIFQQSNVKPFFMARGINFDELKDRIVILASREFSKSTLVVYVFLWMAAKGSIPGFGDVHYGIYVSDSMRNGVETTMTTIRKVYNESIYLRSLFEDVRLISTEVNFIRRPTSKKDIDAYHQHVEVQKGKPEEVPGRMKRTFTLVGIGANTGGRGSRDGLARPDFTVFDDLIPSESDAASDTILKSVESTIEADVLPGMNNNKNFSIMIGTPYSKKDSVYRRVELGTWLPIVFPRGNMLPSDKNTFVSVWPDRHSFENCSREYKRAIKSKDVGDPMPMRKLMQEHYLRISSEEDRMIPQQLIQWYSRSKIENRLSQYNLYMTSDFTTTGGSGSDNSGIATWALSSNGDWFMLDLSLKQLELEDQYNEVFRQNNYWTRNNMRGLTAGIEVDGNQRTHILALKDRMVLRNEWFTIGKQRGAKAGSEGILSRAGGGNKHDRFRNTLPLFQNRKIWLPEELKELPDMRELLEELEYVTYTAIGTKKDDGLDLISQLIMLETVVPMRSMYEDEDDKEEKQLKQRHGMWEHHDFRREEDDSAYSSYV